MIPQLTPLTTAPVLASSASAQCATIQDMNLKTAELLSIESTKDLYHVGEVVWAPRGLRKVYWPAECLHLGTPQLSASVQYLGQHSETTVVPVADLLPFVPHFERLSKQSTLNIFVDAVQKGVEKATRKVTEMKRLESGDVCESLPTPGERSPMMTAKRSPSFLNIQVGTRVRIRGADQIHHKLREYANSEGVIYEAPLHPNTWFGVQLCDGRRVKIRHSAFDVLLPHEPPSIALPKSAVMTTVPPFFGMPTFPLAPPPPPALIPPAPNTPTTLVSSPLATLPALTTPTVSATSSSSSAAASPSSTSSAVSSSSIAITVSPPRVEPQSDAAVKSEAAPSTTSASALSLGTTSASSSALSSYWAPGSRVRVKSLNQLATVLAVSGNQLMLLLADQSKVTRSPDDLELVAPPVPVYPFNVASLPPFSTPNAPSIFQFSTQSLPISATSSALAPSSLFGAPSLPAAQSALLSSLSKPKRPLTKPAKTAATTLKAKNLVGRWVVIDSGRYKGEVGFVVRGGNGYYSVQFSHDHDSNIVMKRSTDLRALHVPASASFEEAQRVARARAWSNANAPIASRPPPLPPFPPGLVPSGTAASFPPPLSFPTTLSAPALTSTSFLPLDSASSASTSLMSSSSFTPLMPTAPSQMSPPRAPDAGRPRHAVSQDDEDWVPSRSASRDRDESPPRETKRVRKTGMSNSISLDSINVAAVSSLSLFSGGSSANRSLDHDRDERERSTTPHRRDSRDSTSRERELNNKEVWIDRKVYIKMGKNAGQVGTVRRSGHGFYGVEIEGGAAEVMKRAIELELYDERVHGAGATGSSSTSGSPITPGSGVTASHSAGASTSSTGSASTTTAASGSLMLMSDEEERLPVPAAAPSSTARRHKNSSDDEYEDAPVPAPTREKAASASVENAASILLDLMGGEIEPEPRKASPLRMHRPPQHRVHGHKPYSRDRDRDREHESRESRESRESQPRESPARGPRPAVIVQVYTAATARPRRDEYEYEHDRDHDRDRERDDVDSEMSDNEDTANYQIGLDSDLN